MRSDQGEARAMRMRHVLPALFVLFLGCIIGFMIFLFEISAHFKLAARSVPILRRVLSRFQGRFLTGSNQQDDLTTMREDEREMEGTS